MTRFVESPLIHKSERAFSSSLVTANRMQRSNLIIVHKSYCEVASLEFFHVTICLLPQAIRFVTVHSPLLTILAQVVSSVDHVCLLIHVGVSLFDDNGELKGQY